MGQGKKVWACTLIVVIPILCEGISQIISTPYCRPIIKQREQGWRMRSGESIRLPPMWPGFNSRSWRHMWVEFVVGSRPCSEGFSPRTPVFLPPQKPTFPKSNSTWNCGEKSHSMDSTEIPIIFYLLLFYFTTVGSVLLRVVKRSRVSA